MPMESFSEPKGHRYESEEHLDPLNRPLSNASNFNTNQTKSKN